MKNVLMFLLLITVCGSLSNRPEVVPCSKKVAIHHYKNGKLVKTYYGFWYSINNLKMHDTDADSVVVEMKNYRP
jgi:hypothetical protein